MEKHPDYLLEELRSFDAPTVCNALECFGLTPRNQGFTRPGMVQRTDQGKPMIGYAVTAKVSAMYPGNTGSEEILMSYYQKVEDMGEYGIAVIQDTDRLLLGRSAGHRSQGIWQRWIHYCRWRQRYPGSK